MDYGRHRHTKIIFTIGPATESEDMLEQLIINKVDICRLNMAHASHDWTRNIIQKIRKVCKKVDRHIAIMMDVKGPEIRTGIIDGSWDLQEGETFDFYMDKAVQPENGIRGVDVNYPNLINDIHEGDRVLVDSGLIQMQVLKKGNGRIRCEVKIGGPIKSKRHINLPGVKVNLPALTDKDRGDIDVAVEEGIDFFALSFVRESKDVEELREYLDSKNCKARIISKIEDQCGIANLDDIIEESDGIMIARGDLGIECPYNTLPIIQRNAVERCIHLGRPVIVATHMLESMIDAPVPTRAEVSDIANAVYEKADCIMLSGETTIGKYPLECIDVMKNIAYTLEANVKPSYNEKFKLWSAKNKMLRSSVVLAQELDNTGIMVFTRSGVSAQLISSLRPTRCPLYVFTDNELVSRQMRVLWGIEPFFIEFSKDHNETIAKATEKLKSRKSIVKGDWVIVLTNINVQNKHVDTIQLRKVD